MNTLCMESGFVSLNKQGEDLCGDFFTTVSDDDATTFVLSAIGVKVGSVFGSKYEKKAEIVGGVILILLGVKILLDHLGIL